MQLTDFLKQGHKNVTKKKNKNKQNSDKQKLKNTNKKFFLLSATCRTICTPKKLLETWQHRVKEKERDRKKRDGEFFCQMAARRLSCERSQGSRLNEFGARERQSGGGF